VSELVQPQQGLKDALEDLFKSFEKFREWIEALLAGLKGIGQAQKVGPQALSTSSPHVEAVAQAIHGLPGFDVLDITCIRQAVADSLRELAAILEGPSDDGHPTTAELIATFLPIFNRMVLCHVGGGTTPTPQAGAQAIDPKLITCGIQAAIAYFTTRNAAAALQAFFTCMIGTGGGGGGTGGGTSGFVSRDVARCG
jgi:hypothetical protein